MSRPVPGTQLSDADRARLAARYPPPRVPRAVIVALVTVGALISLGWLIVTAISHSDPPVSGQVTAFKVEADTKISVTLTVTRPDPSVRVSCRIVAKATDFQPVGEVTVQVPATSYRVGDVPVDITTVRRATSAEVASCAVS